MAGWHHGSGELDEGLLSEIETLAQEAMSGFEIFDSENLEISDTDMDRMAQAFNIGA